MRLNVIHSKGPGVIQALMHWDAPILRRHETASQPGTRNTFSWIRALSMPRLGRARNVPHLAQSFEEAEYLGKVVWDRIGNDPGSVARRGVDGHAVVESETRGDQRTELFLHTFLDTQDVLDQAGYSLNTRPRQTLSDMTPSDKLAEAMQ
jgi:hypothetical protein